MIRNQLILLTFLLCVTPNSSSMSITPLVVDPPFQAPIIANQTDGPVEFTLRFRYQTRVTTFNLFQPSAPGTYVGSIEGPKVTITLISKEAKDLAFISSSLKEWQQFTQAHIAGLAQIKANSNRNKTLSLKPYKNGKNPLICAENE